jgi:ABC-type transport system involved in cytochrome bd biosynthesis fused ATPase/permease subunit
MLLLPVAAWADKVLPYMLISYAAFGIQARLSYRKNYVQVTQIRGSKLNRLLTTVRKYKKKSTHNNDESCK